MEKKKTHLQNEVQKAILDDSHTREHGIETLEDNGVITLKGSVPSVEIGQTARKIAAKVPGVAGVINALEIQGSEKGTTI
jgi:osmotically-inducible protein OsmY